MKIKKNFIFRLFYIILFLLFCRNVIVIYPLYNIYIVDRIYSYVALAVGSVFIAWFLYTHLCHTANVFFIILFKTVLEIFSNIINGGTMKVPIMSFIYPCALYCFAIYITEKKRLDYFIKDISIFFLILSTINLLLMGPQGNFYRDLQYFLGLENQISFTLLLGLYFSWLNSIYNDKKITLILYIIIYLVSSIIIGSASGMVSVIIFLLINLIPYVKKIIQKLSTQIFPLIIIGIVLFLVFYTLFGIENNFIKWFVVDVLKKDLTFTGRTKIWSILLKNMNHFFLFGHGAPENSNIFYIDGQTLSAHNTFLAVLYNGGIACVCITILLVFVATKYIDKIQSERIKMVHKIMLLLISIPMLSENVSMNSLYIILFIGVGISVNLIKTKNKRLLQGEKYYDS